MVPPVSGCNFKLADRSQTICLFWKCILLLFGGCKDLERAKEVLEPKCDDGEQGSNMPVLTASPLDYHMFRQEITSKYPAYNPPPPLFAFEPENNSILPPLPHQASKYSSASGIFPGMGSTPMVENGSILHQPVHIATPAPSPPPSPIGPGGKSGKKQNYQTNQNFPFMYPPLDQTSNDIGGKGSSGLQDHLVGKEWKGGDVPASIVEAGELFSSRMKMTRAIRQLWEEREEFLKYDRGWEAKAQNPKQHETGEEERSTSGTSSPKSAHQVEETDDRDIQRRLNAVEDFYVSFP